MNSPPHLPNASQRPFSNRHRPSQSRLPTSGLREAVLEYVAPKGMANITENLESSNRHFVPGLPKPNPKPQNQHNRTRTKSDSRRPCTPALSLTTSETVSPHSVLTVSPISPIGQLGRYRAYSTTSQTSMHRQTALKLSKAPKKQDISPPVPSPVDAAFDSEVSYRPRRRAPTTPPSQVLPDTSSSTYVERSFMEWDDETSALLKVKQTLGLGQPKSMGHAASRIPESKTKNPDKHANATPRQLPGKTKSAQLGSAIQQSKPSNFSRPRKRPAYTTMPRVPSPSSPLQNVDVFYRGPDLTGRTDAQDHDTKDSPQQRSSTKLPGSPGTSTNTRRHHTPASALVPTQAPPRGQVQHSPSQRATATNTEARFSPPKAQQQYTRRVNVNYDANNSCSEPGPYPANEAVRVDTSSTAPPSRTAQSTSTVTHNSSEKPRRLKALMRGLVKRASGRGLRRDKEQGG